MEELEFDPLEPAPDIEPRRSRYLKIPRYDFAEQHMREREGYIVWKDEVRRYICEAIDEASNWEEFIEILDAYEVQVLRDSPLLFKVKVRDEERKIKLKTLFYNVSNRADIEELLWSIS